MKTRGRSSKKETTSLVLLLPPPRSKAYGKKNAVLRNKEEERRTLFYFLVGGSLLGTRSRPFMRWNRERRKHMVKKRKRKSTREIEKKGEDYRHANSLEKIGEYQRIIERERKRMKRVK